jgi:hypothetical protein
MAQMEAHAGPLLAGTPAAAAHVASEKTLTHFSSAIIFMGFAEMLAFWLAAYLSFFYNVANEGMRGVGRSINNSAEAVQNSFIKFFYGYSCESEFLPYFKIERDYRPLALPSGAEVFCAYEARFTWSLESVMGVAAAEDKAWLFVDTGRSFGKRTGQRYPISGKDFRLREFRILSQQDKYGALPSVHVGIVHSEGGKEKLKIYRNLEPPGSFRESTYVLALAAEGHEIFFKDFLGSANTDVAVVNRRKDNKIELAVASSY